MDILSLSNADASLIISMIALVSAAGGIITAFATRRKASAEASDIILEGAMKLVEPLNKRIAALEKQTAAQEKEILELTRGVKILIGQIKRTGCVPEWEPKAVAAVR